MRLPRPSRPYQRNTSPKPALPGAGLLLGARAWYLPGGPVEAGESRVEVAKKVARKSARIAHDLASDEPATARARKKPLQMHTIFRAR
jgi:hypothetical protein